MVTLTIDGIKVTVPPEYTILEAAKKAGISIPTLCYLKGVNEVGACRVCLVGSRGSQGSFRGMRSACRRGHGCQYKQYKSQNDKKIDA